MCSAPNVYMFVYILIGTHMVPLRKDKKMTELVACRIKPESEVIGVNIVLFKMFSQ